MPNAGLAAEPGAVRPTQMDAAPALQLAVRKRGNTMHAESVVTRSMVRGIIVNELGEVLLMKMNFPWFGAPVWIAPGGGLGETETAVDGLRRELQEETGRSDLQIGPQVWE